jgi:TFIIH basal transcription factor complex TTD-A subunit
VRISRHVMVASEPGVLVSCDIPVKQFLLWLDDQQENNGSRFIITDLDDTHVFVKEDAVKLIREELNRLYEENQYSFIK